MKSILIILLCIGSVTSKAQIPFQDDNDKFGLKDDNGNIIIPGTYDLIDTFSNGGLAVVRQGIKYGFIDKAGKEIIKPEYYFAYGFSEGLAAVSAYNEDGVVWRYIDKTGKVVISCKKNRIAGPFSGGLAKIMSKENKKIGFIDKTGKEIIPPKYDDIGLLSEGMLAVKLNDKWGYIDSTGKEVIPCKYDFAGTFSMGRALVMSGGKMLHLDKTGKELL